MGVQGQEPQRLPFDLDTTRYRRKSVAGQVLQFELLDWPAAQHAEPVRILAHVETALLIARDLQQCAPPGSGNLLQHDEIGRVRLEPVGEASRVVVAELQVRRNDRERRTAAGRRRLIRHRALQCGQCVKNGEYGRDRGSAPTAEQQQRDRE